MATCCSSIVTRDFLKRGPLVRPDTRHRGEYVLSEVTAYRYGWATQVTRTSRVRCILSPEPRPDDLDRDDEDQVRDRHGREETEGGAPAAAPDRGPRPGRLRDHEVGDDRPEDQHEHDVDRDGQRPQGAAREGGAATERHVVGEVGDG